MVMRRGVAAAAAAILLVLAARGELPPFKECDGTDPSFESPCFIKILEGPDILNGTNDSITNHTGTLDFLYQASRLEYYAEHVGSRGWPSAASDGERRNWGEPTSRACYNTESTYFCSPGPCSVLDVNYLADMAYDPSEVGGAENGRRVFGRGYCGPVFGIQMQFKTTFTHRMLEPPKPGTKGYRIKAVKHHRNKVVPQLPGLKHALKELPGPTPEDVQELIPQNDIFNSIPAWYYESWKDYFTASSKRRTDGRSCFGRSIPMWLIPEPGHTTRCRPPMTAKRKKNHHGHKKYISYSDVSCDMESSFGSADMMIGGTKGNAAGTRRDKPTEYADASAKTENTASLPVLLTKSTLGIPAEGNYPASMYTLGRGGEFTLCDANYLKGVMVGFANTLDMDFEALAGSIRGTPVVAGLTLDAPDETIPTIPVIVCGPLAGLPHPVDFTQYDALRLVMACASTSTTYANADGTNTVDLLSFIRDWEAYAANPMNRFKMATNAADATTSVPDLFAAYDPIISQAIYALGQLMNIVRPCDSFRTRRSKIMKSVRAGWARSQFNPGHARAAVEVDLGCKQRDPTMYNNLVDETEGNDFGDGQCAAVRGRHDWPIKSDCTPIGGCTHHGYTCCNAYHLPAIDKGGGLDVKYIHYGADGCHGKDYEDNIKSMMEKEAMVEGASIAIASTIPVAGEFYDATVAAYSALTDGVQAIVAAIKNRGMAIQKCGVQMEKKSGVYHNRGSNNLDHPKGKKNSMNRKFPDRDHLFSVNPATVENVCSNPDVLANVLIVLSSCAAAVGIKDVEKLEAAIQWDGDPNTVCTAADGASPNGCCDVTKFPAFSGDHHAFGTTEDPSQYAPLAKTAADGGNQYSAFDVCKQYNAQLVEPASPLALSGGATWENVVTLAAAGTLQRYMFKDEASASVNDDTYVGKHHAKGKKQDPNSRLGLTVRAMSRPDRALLSAIESLGDASADLDGTAKHSDPCYGYFTTDDYTAVKTFIIDYLERTKHDEPGREGVADTDDELQSYVNFTILNHPPTSIMPGVCGWSENELDRLPVYFDDPGPAQSASEWIRKELVPIHTCTAPGTPGEFTPWACSMVATAEVMHSMSRTYNGNMGSALESISIRLKNDFKTQASTKAALKAPTGDSPTIDEYKKACVRQRVKGCVGVLEVTNGGTSLRLVHYKDVITAKNNPVTGAGPVYFHFAPCFGVVAPTTLFGCRPRATADAPIDVRTTFPTLELDIGGPRRSFLEYEYPLAYDSFFEDTLRDVSLNTRFTLNRKAFEGGRSTFGESDLTTLGKYGVFPMDFDLGAWRQTSELEDTTKKFHRSDTRTTRGTVYTDTDRRKAGLQFVPSVDVSDTRDKLFAFSWAAMFDQDAYVHSRSRSYQFVHPVFKDASQFTAPRECFSSIASGAVAYPAPADVFVDDKKLCISDVLRGQLDGVPDDESGAAFKAVSDQRIRFAVRTMVAARCQEPSINEAVLDSFATAGIDSQPTLARVPSAPNRSCSLGGYIDPATGIVEPRTAGVGRNSAPADFLKQLNPQTNFDLFVEHYESICDLHSCDILQVVPDEFLNSAGDSRAFGDSLLPFDIPARAYASKDGIDPTSPYATDLNKRMMAFRCVPRNFTFFQRGVDLNGGLHTFDAPDADQSTSDNLYQSGLGILGYPLIGIESAVLRGVLERMYAALQIDSGGSTDKQQCEAAVGDTSTVAGRTMSAIKVALCELTDFCTQYNTANDQQTVLLKDQSFCGEVKLFSDALVKTYVRSSTPYKQKSGSPVEAYESAVPLFTENGKEKRGSLDYNKVNTSDIYQEHREALPITMTRSSKYSNREEHKNAVPCDCDDQKIVWMCERLLDEGSDTPFAEKISYRSDLPDLTGREGFEAGYSLDGTVDLIECGYSWKTPPARTPRIGLYVPSKIDLFTVYERDVFGGVPRIPSVLDEANCINNPSFTDPSQVGGPPPPASGATTANPTTTTPVAPANRPFQDNTTNCVVERSAASLNKACAAEVFSTPMAPRASKLRELLFTGKHPLPSTFDSLDKKREVLNDDELFTSIMEVHQTTGDDAEEDPGENVTVGAGPKCWQLQSQIVFDSPCLRWPFGITPAATLGSGTAGSARRVSTIYGPVNAEFSENKKTFKQAYRVKTAGWQGYCEYEREPAVMEPNSNFFKEQANPSPKLRYCQNDGYSFDDRNEMCDRFPSHFVMYGFALPAERSAANACSKESKLCLIIPGYETTGSIARMMDGGGLGTLEGYTFLVTPFGKETIDQYFAGRSLFEVGNTFGASRYRSMRNTMTLGPGQPQLGADLFPPKDALDIQRQETMSRATADYNLTEQDSFFTGYRSNVEAFALMAKMPKQMTVVKAKALVDSIVDNLLQLCTLTGGGRCKFDSMQTGTFSIPARPSALSDNHLRDATYDNVFQPHRAERILIDAPDITVESASAHLPLRFEAYPETIGNRHKKVTCDRFVVGAPRFTLKKTVFNQTGCASLSPSQQTPIVFSGKDASSANVRFSAVYADSVTSSVDMVALGEDTRFFTDASKMINVQGLVAKFDTQYQNMSSLQLTCTEPVGGEHFAAGFARASGKVSIIQDADGQCGDNLIRVLEQQPELPGGGGGVQYECQGKKIPLDDTDGAVVVGRRCLLTNMSDLLGVFGSTYERGVYPVRHSRYHLAILFFTVLAAYVGGVLVLNAGLTLVGNYRAHRMIGLLPPMAPIDVYRKLTHEKARRHQAGKSERKTFGNTYVELRPNASGTADEGCYVGIVGSENEGEEIWSVVHSMEDKRHVPLLPELDHTVRARIASLADAPRAPL